MYLLIGRKTLGKWKLAYMCKWDLVYICVVWVPKDSWWSQIFPRGKSHHHPELGRGGSAPSHMQKDGWIKLSDSASVTGTLPDGLNDEAWRPRFQIGSEKSLIFCEKVFWGFPEWRTETYNKWTLSPTNLSRRGSFPWRPRTPRWPRAPCRSAI